MKRSIWKRIRWDNVSLLLATGAVIAAGAWGMYHRQPLFDYSKLTPSHIVTYNYRIQGGIPSGAWQAVWPCRRTIYSDLFSGLWKIIALKIPARFSRER